MKKYPLFLCLLLAASLAACTPAEEKQEERQTAIPAADTKVPFESENVALRRFPI